MFPPHTDPLWIAARDDEPRLFAEQWQASDDTPDSLPWEAWAIVGVFAVVGVGALIAGISLRV